MVRPSQRNKPAHWMHDVSLDDEVADAIAATHPDRAVAIWKELAENEIALVKPRAYQDAIPYLRKARNVLTRSGREGSGKSTSPP